MIRPVPPSAPESRANAALTMLYSKDLTKDLIQEQRPHSLEAVAIPQDIAIDDWNLLFRAVEARLKLAVGKRLAATPGSQLHDERASRVQAIVLQCVEALDRLHAALALERSRRHLPEPELLDVRAAVPQTISELLRTSRS